VYCIARAAGLPPVPPCCPVTHLLGPSLWCTSLPGSQAKLGAAALARWVHGAWRAL